LTVQALNRQRQRRLSCRYASPGGFQRRLSGTFLNLNLFGFQPDKKVPLRHGIADYEQNFACDPGATCRNLGLNGSDQLTDDGRCVRYRAKRDNLCHDRGGATLRLRHS